MITHRYFKIINSIGVTALAKSEILRLWQMKEWWATDIMSVTLYILIAKIALGEDAYQLQNLNYITYLACGLLISHCFLRAFEGAGFILMDIKMNGVFNDYLITPMTPAELLAVWTAAAILHSALITIAMIILFYLLGIPTFQFSIISISMLILFSITAASIGHFAALLSQKWDHIVGVDVYIVMPIILLSGVFFAPSQLPKSFAPLFNYNPFFQIIDSLRTQISLNKSAEITPIIIAIILAIITFTASWICLQKGWGVKT